MLKRLTFVLETRTFDFDFGALVVGFEWKTLTFELVEIVNFDFDFDAMVGVEWKTLTFELVDFDFDFEAMVVGFEWTTLTFELVEIVDLGTLTVDLM